MPEGDDFERCAIEIWVKFRDEEELQRLSSHRQSGGERSVSTILYLIAIQARLELRGWRASHTFVLCKQEMRTQRLWQPLALGIERHVHTLSYLVADQACLCAMPMTVPCSSV